MPTPNTSAFAIGQFNKFANDIEALRTIAFFYLSAFPEYAEAATLGVNKLSPLGQCLPQASERKDAEHNEFMQWVHVPASAEFCWLPATYKLTINQIRHWMSLYRYNYVNGFRSGKVDAIKACRSDLGLDLKQAKDLCEYLATKEW